MHKILLYVHPSRTMRILRKRITLLINLRHEQIVVGLVLSLLLLLGIELWVLTERHDRRVERK